MYAIIEDSGCQIKVSPGDVVDLDPRGDEVSDGGTVTLDRVLAIGGGEGDASIGRPYLPGASVTASVLGAAVGPKLRIVKYKRRKGYRKTIGHRQEALRVRIEAIHPG